MTMLAVPLPPSPEPSRPVHRVTWRQCLYAAVGLIWWVVLAHFLVSPPEIGWWVVLLIWAPAMVGIDYGISTGLLATEPHESTPTHAPCCGCGDLWPRQLLRVEDGLWCPQCETEPVSIELDNEMPAQVGVVR